MSQVLRRSLLILCALAALLVLAAALGLLPDRLVHRDNFDAAGKVVEGVERFRQQHGRLPVDLREVGIDERLDGPIHYARRDSGRYEVWFGTTLGESVTYDSEMQTWE